MNHNHIYVEPSFWVASNADEHAVKQLCVELENKLNSSDMEEWSDIVQRCKNHWALASSITIERYPVTIQSVPEIFPVVPASSKVVLKNLSTSEEFLDVPNASALKAALRS